MRLDASTRSVFRYRFFPLCIVTIVPPESAAPSASGVDATNVGRCKAGASIGIEMKEASNSLQKLPCRTNVRRGENRNLTMKRFHSATCRFVEIRDKFCMFRQQRLDRFAREPIDFAVRPRDGSSRVRCRGEHANLADVFASTNAADRFGRGS